MKDKTKTCTFGGRHLWDCRMNGEDEGEGIGLVGFVHIKEIER
jgi:hypothetical protein